MKAAQRPLAYRKQDAGPGLKSKRPSARGPHAGGTPGPPASSEHLNKEQTPLAICSDTDPRIHGGSFSVLGTPPAKPLDCKSRSSSYDGATHRRSHPARGGRSAEAGAAVAGSHSGLGVFGRHHFHRPPVEPPAPPEPADRCRELGSFRQTPFFGPGDPGRRANRSASRPRRASVGRCVRGLHRLV